MLFITFFGLMALAIPSVTGFAVTGTQGGVDNTTGFRPMRIEINQFRYAGPAWDLYIQSLQQLLFTNQSGQFSFYQIAGIHGYPNVDWDGVTGSGGGVGYCTHGSILFPVWHRPYLALFENILWNNAQSIAAQYPASQKPMYQDAAVTMRIPYWDWSINSTMPDVTTNPKIAVNTPQGSQVIDNPLFNYTFHPLVSSDLPDLSQYPTTVRYPDPNTMQSQEGMANAALNNAASYWHDSAYLLFSSQPDYQQFSNVYGGADNSIENIHGGIHNYVGGSSPNLGHMTLLWYSAMDPIFWLHHANVDRLTAIWQAIYPDSYVVPQASQLESTYYTAIGSVEDDTSPLAPFHSDSNSSLHTALTVQYLKPFGYTYPELIDWTATSPSDYSQRVTTIVNEIYHPNFAPNVARRDDNGQPVGAALAADWEWILSLHVNRTALPQPMTLYFFSSPPPSGSDPNTWGSLPSLIGSQILLHPPPSPSPSSANATAKPGKGGAPFSPPRSSIPLTPELLSLSSLDPETVIPRLWPLWWEAVPVTTSTSGGSPPDVDAGPMGRRDRGFAGVRRAVRRGSDSRSGRGAGKNVLGNAVSVGVKARRVSQPADKGQFPTYGEWKVYGRAVLTGSGGNVTCS